MRWLRGKAASSSLTVSEEDGVRYMHLGGDHIQSAMRLDAPHALELDYTQTMMAFLLFHPRPSECLMVGLGGGSIPKFMHRKFRAARMRVLELNPAVVTAARSLFHLPDDDARLRVEVSDGARAVHVARGRYDVLFADGFIDGEQVPELVSQEFYEAARRALRLPGVLVVNFFGHDRKFERYLRRLEAAFEGCVVCLEARDDGNVIAFALKGMPDSLSWDELFKRAQRLEARLGLPFTRYARGLKRMNRWTRNELLLVPAS